MAALGFSSNIHPTTATERRVSASITMKSRFFRFARPLVASLAIVTAAINCGGKAPGRETPTDPAQQQNQNPGQVTPYLKITCENGYTQTFKPPDIAPSKKNPAPWFRFYVQRQDRDPSIPPETVNGILMMDMSRENEPKKSAYFAFYEMSGKIDKNLNLDGDPIPGRDIVSPGILYDLKTIRDIRDSSYPPLDFRYSKEGEGSTYMEITCYAHPGDSPGKCSLRFNAAVRKCGDAVSGVATITKVGSSVGPQLYDKRCEIEFSAPYYGNPKSANSCEAQPGG